MAGAGYKLFNTGDVLTAAQVNTYLMEQTVMVFADATARTAALSGVVSEGMISYLKDTNAVEVYNGSAWVASDDPNAIQNTIVDAKGDLITATAADTPARLAVGNNGETLVADSSASTGLRWQVGVNTNSIINGGQDVWQRGTSIAVGAAIVYTADRWQAYRQGVVAGSTVSRQSASLAGVQYCARVQRDSGNTSTAAINYNYQLETIDSFRFVSQPVVMSFYARAGSNFSSSGSGLVAGIRSGTGTDQTIVGGFTGGATVGETSAVLTTSWQRFTVTGTVGSTVTQLGVYFYYSPTGTASTNDYFEITGVQLELGTTPTAFKRAGNTLAGELAACQRYYYRVTSGTAYTIFSTGANVSTTQARVNVPLAVTMRVAPTSSIDYATLGLAEPGAGVIAATSVTFSDSNPNNVNLLVNVASGLTAQRTSYLYSNNSTTAYLGFTAEL